MCSFSCLASFISMFWSSSMLYYVSVHSFLLMLVYYCITFLSIHWTGDGHLECFQLPAIIINVAVNICVHVFVWTCILTIYVGSYERVELLGHSYFTFKKLSSFPKWLHHFTFINSNVWGLQLFHILTNICYLFITRKGLFIIPFLMGVKWYLNCAFSLHFPND